MFYFCDMESSKKNFLGDLVMSSVVGCAAFVSLIILSLAMGGMFVLFHSIIKF
jgi:hypothetical protein